MGGMGLLVVAWWHGGMGGMAYYESAWHGGMGGMAFPGMAVRQLRHSESRLGMAAWAAWDYWWWHGGMVAWWHGRHGIL
jgi:hypothetical protein